MKLDRIYTRSGDDGRTSLGDGARLPKFHARVTAHRRKRAMEARATSIIGCRVVKEEPTSLAPNTAHGPMITALRGYESFLR